MDRAAASRIVGGNSAYKRAESDFYPTPPDVTEALLDFIDLPLNTVIWEPACGEGHMVDVMQKRGYRVIATDIRQGIDFLTSGDYQCDWIITNPPFSVADKFIERCIASGKPFALLLKSQYWHAKKRLMLFRNCPPTFVCPLTWRPDFTFNTRGKGSPLMDVMWAIWERGRVTRYIPMERPKKEVAI